MSINDFPLPKSESELVPAALAYIDSLFQREGPLSSPDLVSEFLRLKLGLQEREVFAVIFLCNRHFVISYEEVFTGTINGATVHAREIVKMALYKNAAAVILAHNHPSGVPEPSQSDIALTNKLIDALKLIEIRVLDHIIVGGAQFVSLSNRGLI